MNTFYKDVLKGGAKSDQAIARATLGSSVGFALFSTTINDENSTWYITGAGPDVDKGARSGKRQAWLHDNKPYSICNRNSGKCYQYNRLEPIGAILGMWANIADVIKYGNADFQDDKAAMVIAAGASTARYMKDKSVMQGLSNLMDLFGGGDKAIRAGDKMAKGLLGGFIPYSAALNTVTQAQDPHIKEVDDYSQAIMARIPGMGGDLPNAVNILGDDFVRPDKTLGWFLPISNTPGKDADSKLFKHLQDIDSGITEPRAEISMKGNSVKLNAQQHYTRMKLVANTKINGKTLKQSMKAIMNNPLYKRSKKNVEIGGKKDVMEAEYRKYLKVANEIFLKDNPEIIAEMDQNRIDKRTIEKPIESESKTKFKEFIGE